MKQLLFSPRDPESLYQEVVKHADQQHGARAAMNEYYHRAGEIGDQMEEDRLIDVTCSCFNFAAYSEIMKNIDSDCWMVKNNEDFDEA